MGSGLYGIKNTNRPEKKHWGKNCFNSSFPTALACYMMDHNIPAVYMKLDVIGGKPMVVSDTIPIEELFNCEGLSTDDLYFSFETVFDPYKKYSFDAIDGVDLVVKDKNANFLAPVEIKLTVLPNDSTSKKPEDQWGCELVIRSATTSYCALGIYDSVADESRNIREIFEDTCSGIQDWKNDYEMTHKLPMVCDCVNCFERQYYQKQKPLLMQTIWKTQGKSPILADNAFDIVVWSDYALSRFFLDDDYSEEETMSRPMRAAAKFARCIWELSKSGKIQIMEIYRQMAYDNQTDKEFAIGGQKWRSYVKAERTLNPILPKTVVNEIIEPRYIEMLRPERRFDQTLYFTARG